MEIRETDIDFDEDKYDKLGLKFRGGNDTLFLDYTAYGRSVQKILIKDLKKKKTKFYFTKFTRSFFGIAVIIDILLEIKLLEKGCTLIHSGGITKNGKGFLISAWSEMGKSSTVFGLARRNFGVLGDDTVILAKNGRIFSFPEKAGIYFHSKNVENLRLSPMNKAKLFAKYIISKLPPLYLYVDPNLRIDLSKMLKVEKTANLEKTYFLEWGTGVEKLDKKIAINKLISSTIHAWFNNFFAREMFVAYCYLNDFDPLFIENGMKAVLEKALIDCEIIRSTKKDYYKHFLDEEK